MSWYRLLYWQKEEWEEMGNVVSILGIYAKKKSEEKIIIIKKGK